MKITGSNLFNASFASLATSLGGIGKKAENADKAQESPDSKRIKGMQDALRQLKANMNSRQMDKNASAEKIGILQRRLVELKQMLLFATPEQAKALASELKSIAGELASAAKAAGGAYGGSQAGSMVTPVVADLDPASAQGKVETASAAVSAEAATAEAKEAADATAVQGSDTAADQSDKVARRDASLSDEKRSNQSPVATGISDKDLKDMLGEARKLLKEVINKVKSKMDHGDKDSRKNLEDAEMKLREIGLNIETQVTSASLYTSRGVAPPDIGGVDGLAATGTNISAEA